MKKGVDIVLVAVVALGTVGIGASSAVAAGGGEYSISLDSVQIVVSNDGGAVATAMDAWASCSYTVDAPTGEEEEDETGGEGDYYVVEEYTWDWEGGTATEQEGDWHYRVEWDDSGWYTIALSCEVELRRVGTEALLATDGPTEITVTIPVVQMSMLIHDGLEGVSGGAVVPDPLDLFRGAITVANLNDTDGDGQVDKDDLDVSVAGANPPGRHEHDLMKLLIGKPAPADAASAVRVRVVKGPVELWKDCAPPKRQSKANGQAVLMQTIAAFTADENGDGVDDIAMWIEGRAPSELRGIELVYEYQPSTGSTNWVWCDTVRATALWVVRTSRSPWRKRQAATGFPDNPSVGAGGNLPDLDDPDPVKAINVDRRSVDGSRYGRGTMMNIAGVDQRIGGRILHELEVTPSGVEQLDVVFDVTRQLAERNYEVASGALMGQPVQSKDFPWQQTPVRDNEMPNDDTSVDDEDNQPTNRRLYSFDPPGVPRNVAAMDTAFAVIRMTFDEWVRVKLNNEAIKHDPEPRAPLASGLRVVQGSRASMKEDWHFVTYLKRSGAGTMVHDTTQATASAPIFTGTGNGTAQATLAAHAVSEGYTATYDLANKRWTLTATCGLSVSDSKTGAVPAGTTWTVDLAVLGAKVVITQGATAFAHGDKFEFSVFRTGDPLGKRNEIAPGACTVTGNP